VPVERFATAVWVIGGILTFVQFFNFFFIYTDTIPDVLGIGIGNLSLAFQAAWMTIFIGAALYWVNRKPANYKQSVNEDPKVTQSRYVRNHFKTLTIIFSVGLAVICVLFLIVGGFTLYVFKTMFYTVFFLALGFGFIALREYSWWNIYGVDFDNQILVPRSASMVMIILYGALGIIGVALSLVLLNFVLALGIALAAGLFVFIGARALHKNKLKQ
jgi:hypothetical protein